MKFVNNESEGENMNVGERIKQLRKEKNLTLRELAEKADISISFLSDIENGRSNPSLERLKAIAEALDTTVSYLLGENSTAFIPDDYAKKHKVTKKDLLQYEDFIKNAGAFFMNDEVAEEDKEKLFKDISELFWKAKEINKEKYGRKKKKNAK